MTTRTRRVFGPPERVRLLFALGLGGVAFCAAGAPVLAKSISRRQAMFERMLYQELHPGKLTTFFEFGGFHEWAKKEKERLEPIVLEILQGKREGVPWNYAVSFVARDIPTKAICDAVHEHMKPILAKERTNGETLTLSDHSRLVGLLSVLAEGYDARAVESLNSLIAWSACPYGIAYDYLMALRKVGDATSFQALREMPLRKTNDRIDRMAALTEKIIEARVAGKVFPPQTAPDDLRIVTQRFLKACEAADLQAYAACFPWGLNKVLDENQMHEFLDGEHGKHALAAIQSALDAKTPFEIDREKLQAKLVSDGFLVEYIYEIDGWKIMNLRPLTQERANKKVLRQTNPTKKGPKQIFIGKRAKDRKHP